MWYRCLYMLGCVFCFCVFAEKHRDAARRALQKRGFTSDRPVLQQPRHKPKTWVSWRLKLPPVICVWIHAINSLVFFPVGMVLTVWSLIRDTLLWVRQEKIIWSLWSRTGTSRHTHAEILLQFSSLILFCLVLILHFSETELDCSSGYSSAEVDYYCASFHFSQCFIVY